MKEMLQVGEIINTHGLAGEVKVYPTTDDPARFKKLKQVQMDTGNGYTELKIDRVRFFKNLVILHFQGYDRIEDVISWKRRGLFVPRSDAVKLKKDEYYIADLLGMEVFLEDGTAFGTLTDVIETGANDVYAVRTQEYGEVLIPAIHDCILEVCVEENRMRVHLLDGLIESAPGFGTGGAKV